MVFKRMQILPGYSGMNRYTTEKYNFGFRPCIFLKKKAVKGSYFIWVIENDIVSVLQYLRNVSDSFREPE